MCGAELAAHSDVRHTHTIINEKKFGLGIFIDVKKAFDSLHGNIFLEIFRCCGVSNTTWAVFLNLFK